MHRQSYLGAVGNGETLALIAPGFGLDWLCIPRVDALPLFARSLDPRRGGALDLDFAPPLRPTGQEYAGDTNILRTHGTAGPWAVTVEDYMPWGRRQLVRQIRITNTGPAPQRLSWAVRVRPVDTAAWRATARVEDGRWLVEQPGGAAAVAVYAVPEGPEAVGAPLPLGLDGEVPPAELSPSTSVGYVLVLGYGEGLPGALQELIPARGLTEEAAWWADWLATARRPELADPVLRLAYVRSLLVLKLLTYAPTGAILAAGTASFPAIPGGGHQWDYRFCWLRDGYLVARALDAAGLHAEARAFYEWALPLQEPDGRWRQPLYTVDGKDPAELTVPDLQGPGGEVPVRLGNAAAGQLQLDNEPNILCGLADHLAATGDLTFVRRHWERIRRAADFVLENWRNPEAGIWEIRERQDHWLYGKTLCAAGLRAAAMLAHRLGEAADAVRWEAEAATVAAEVAQRGWHPGRGAFLRSYDPRSPLDISVLALGFYGLVPPHDPRLASTAAAMLAPLVPPAERHPDATDATYDGRLAGGLNMKGGIARYDYAALPFYLASFWLARHLLAVGDRTRALELVHTALQSATDLGLMAEHFDPESGAQWGNFPQAFAHSELVMLLLALAGR